MGARAGDGIHCKGVGKELRGRCEPPAQALSTSIEGRSFPDTSITAYRLAIIRQVQSTICVAQAVSHADVTPTEVPMAASSHSPRVDAAYQADSSFLRRVITGPPKAGTLGLGG